MKMRSKAEVSKLATMVNKSHEIHLNNCPRCGKAFPEVGEYVFDGDEYHTWAKCPDCGIMVNLVYEYKFTEIEIWEE